MVDTLIRARDSERAKLGSELGLQSSRHHHSKALDEIYKIVTGLRQEHGVDATPAADNARRTGFWEIFNMLRFF